MTQPQINIKPWALEKAYRIAMARQSFANYMRYTWVRPNEPLIIGRHTKVMCERIDQAKRDYLNGISTRLIITLPFRHGKSDVSSRYLPANLLGWNPDFEIILGSYGSSLSEDFSRDVKAIIDTEAYHDVFPTFPGWDQRTDNAQQRRVASRNGKLLAVGMRGGATGKGANCLILDDVFKNREEADSRTTRKSRWESFKNDFFSRLAPVHIILIVQTRWHVYDVIGRIQAANNPESEDYDQSVPKFETIHFRARGDENIQHTGSQYLFPQRFSDDWYEAQFGIQGEFGSAALLQGEPFLRGGNLLKTDNITWLSPDEEFPEHLYADSLRWVRSWDIAHSEKERAKDDPDYTAGGLVAVIERNAGNTLCVDDVQLAQKEATARNKIITTTARRDSKRGIPQYVEASGAKSSYTTLRDVLDGVAVVHPIYPQNDKVTRAGPVEPIFEAGNVYIRCDPAKRPIVLNQLSNFPTEGVHDDCVDMITNGYTSALKRNEQTAGKSIGNKLDNALC